MDERVQAQSSIIASMYNLLQLVHTSTNVTRHDVEQVLSPRTSETTEDGMVRYSSRSSIRSTDNILISFSYLDVMKLSLGISWIRSDEGTIELIFLKQNFPVKEDAGCLSDNTVLYQHPHLKTMMKGAMW